MTNAPRRADQSGPAESPPRRRLLGPLLDRLSRRSRPLLHVAVDEGKGPVVVLVHGIASSYVTFENLVPLLLPAHRVVAIDLLGFGGSPAPDSATFTLEEHVDYLRRTIAALRLDEPFVLVGHSMGSLVASRFAATHSSKLRGVVLVSPPIYLPPEIVGDPIDRTAMSLYLKAYELLRRKKTFTIRNAALLSRLSPIKNVLEVSERNWRAFVLSLEHSIESQTALTDIASTDVPIHVVYGTLDPFLVPGALRIVERMNHVTVHKVDAGDHLIRKRMARVLAAAIGALEAQDTGAR